VRLAASETRSLADTVEPVEPEAAKHFLGAAVAMDSGATSGSQGLWDDAEAWMAQGGDEMTKALALIKSSDYC
jgi:hypothetical protein